MNAIPRLPAVRPAQSASLARAMSRDLLGFAAPLGPAVTYHTMLSSRDTGGPLGVADGTWPAGAGIPAHRHPGEDELLVVLSGEIELTLSGRTFRRRAGEPAFVPRGTEHGFRAVTEARVLGILTRQGLDAPMTERMGDAPAPAAVPA